MGGRGAVRRVCPARDVPQGRASGAHRRAFPLLYGLLRKSSRAQGGARGGPTVLRGRDLRCRRGRSGAGRAPAIGARVRAAHPYRSPRFHHRNLPRFSGQRRADAPPRRDAGGRRAGVRDGGGGDRAADPGEPCGARAGGAVQPGGGHSQRAGRGGAAGLSDGTRGRRDDLDPRRTGTARTTSSARAAMRRCCSRCSTCCSPRSGSTSG